MTENGKEESGIRRIEIGEICRVEGHEAVLVDIKDCQVQSVKLEVFEGTRFFEKIVLSHPASQLPHITSRVCAICSTGHVLAAINAVERGLSLQVSEPIVRLRELMHLGMIIESHATHIYALALPDYVKVGTVAQLATEHPDEFGAWIRLRNLGSKIQSSVGGRPFHPVNLQVGGFSSWPNPHSLHELLPEIESLLETAIQLCDLLMSFEPPCARTSEPVFMALIPAGEHYSYFGDRVRCSAGWEASIDEYKEYLGEYVNAYSHSKSSSARGQSLMVGSMARLQLFSHLLSNNAARIFQISPFAKGDYNSLWNNLAQAIELVEALVRVETLIRSYLSDEQMIHKTNSLIAANYSKIRAAGAVECPRGTLYHFYEADGNGKITAADMVTPSAQNTARIEQDIREVVTLALSQEMPPQESQIKDHLETLVRAYDPCNTCATHMVRLNINA
jgi:sulfhydrogenase subunit alpha